MHNKFTGDLRYLTKSVSDGYAVDVVYVDFLKAFDMVPHLRLLHKMKGYGVRDDLIKWFHSFLNNRKQRVLLGDVVSDWKSVTSGVPQGSVIGPLLFVIYINDLPERFGNHSKLYADDSKIIAIIKDINSRSNLQNDIDKLTNWTDDWLMRLNASKCKVVHFGRASNNSFLYTLLDQASGTRVPLEESQGEKDLGVYISSDLKWKTHIEMITSKANRILGMLTKTFISRDANLWKTLYISLVRPQLEFASTVWSPYLKSDIELIEKVQHRATNLPKSMRSLNYEDRLKLWGITTLEERRVRGDLIQIYKVVHACENINWFTGPKYAPHTQTRSASCNDTRLTREVFPTRTQNDFGRYVSVRHEYFLNRTTERWNNLSNEQIHARLLNSFKARIDDHR